MHLTGKLTLFSLFVLLAGVLIAQDTIRLRNQQVCAGSIRNVSDVSVKIKTAKGSLKIPVDSIALMQFEGDHVIDRQSNGDIIFAQQLYDSLNTAGFDSAMYNRGADDALHFYRNYRKGQYLTGTLAANFGPVLGLLPVLGFTQEKQNPRKLGVPDFSLYVNNSYRLGYMQMARAMRRKGIWKSYGYGTLTHVVSWGVTSLALYLRNVTKK